MEITIHVIHIYAGGMQINMAAPSQHYGNQGAVQQNIFSMNAFQVSRVTRCKSSNRETRISLRGVKRFEPRNACLAKRCDGSNRETRTLGSIMLRGQFSGLFFVIIFGLFK